MRDWLGAVWGLPPETLALHRDAYGRPHLGGGTHHVDVNWSHSGDWLIAACIEGMAIEGMAIEDMPGKDPQAGGVRVGIDIERLRPRPKALALARRFFAPEEIAWLNAIADDIADDPAALDRAFTRLWCAKEAVLKAHGRGLSFGLHRLRFAPGDDAAAPQLVACDPALGAAAEWRLEAWSPAPGYLATLAWRAASGEVPAADGIGAEAPPTTPSAKPPAA